MNRKEIVLEIRTQRKLKGHKPAVVMLKKISERSIWKERPILSYLLKKIPFIFNGYRF